MRTRFLPSNDAAGASIQALDFVQLPVPHFPPADNSSFFDCFLHCLDEILVFSNSPEIEKLPIDDALSIFLSDVLPHFISGANYEEGSSFAGSNENFEHLPLKETWQGSTEIYNGEKQVVGLGSDKTKIQDEASSDNDGGKALKFVQFEIPEVDPSLLPLGSATCSQKDRSHIFSEISETENTLDMQCSELTVFDHLEIQKFVYSVNDMSTEYLTEQKADSLEDGYSILGELHYRNYDFLLFEVDEESMGITRRISIVDELLNFENIETEHLAQPVEEISNNKDLLGSKEFDYIKDLLNHCAEKKCLEDADFSSHMDYMSIIDLSHLQECSLFHDGRKQNGSIWSMYSLFDEFLFFDLDLYNFHEVTLAAAEQVDAKICESMFGESMNFKNLNELIVSHELTLLDGSFKSLPVPILSDLGHIRPLHSLVEELFAQLDWQSSSTSDSLYLDWHYLGEDGRDIVNYSSCLKMLWDIDTYNTNAALNLSDNRVLFDFILFEDHSDKPKTENYKEMLNIHNNDIPIVHASSGKAEMTSSSNHRHGQTINENFVKKSSVEKSLIFGESMSSDLEFFLNPRINITGRESVIASKSTDVNTVCQVLKSSDDMTATKPSTTVAEKWDIQLHQVKLSDNIILLIDYLQKHFLALWENDEQLIPMHNRSQAGNDMTLLQISKEELMCLINEKSDSGTYMADKDDHIIILTVLYAIKQMAFYLCYYGVQAMFLYIDKLIRNLQCVKSRLCFLHKLIRDEHEKAEKELSMNHPSVSILQEILQKNLSKHSSSKILIVADQVFWWPLEKLMTSLKISYNEPQRISIRPVQQHQCSEIAVSTVDTILSSDCCLVSNDYLSASFPFSKFSFILEYGGSSESSIVSSISPKLDIFPTLYFVKVEVDEPIARALSDCINMTKSIDLEMKKAMGSTMSQKYCKSKLEEILNATPIKDADDNRHVISVNGHKDSNMMPVQSIPVCSEPKQHLPCKLFPNMVIIVNTRNFSEEMVISRRSTYLRILEMEKQGSQVVERDINLPVDVIVSAAVSLTWYDSRNIGKKASALDEAFSCLPLCVESIAANILTSLSFAFSCCILIFEGESSFLSSVMESSDELYAAAAGLGIEIQLFCSYSSEMTEKIILSCIKGATKLSKGIYPKLSDSESLAESFLTAFPSINLLSAHAILSSGETLGKFLELSNEGKIGALKKYQVPDESIALLNATSRYGEREDCKSGTTDCSSSLSSVPDSENIQLKSASERKKPKYTHDFFDDNQPSNHIKSLNQLPDEHLNRTNWPVSHNSWLSRNSLNMAQTREAEMKSQTKSFDISGKPGQFNSSFNDELFNFEEFDANGFETVEFDAKGFEISGDSKKPWIPVIDVECSPERRSPAAAMKNLVRHAMNAPNIQTDNYIGEVIDVDDTPSFWEKDYGARNATAPEISFPANNLHAFPESASDAWTFRGDNGQMLPKEVKKPCFPSIDSQNNILNCQRGLLEEDNGNLSVKRTRKSNSVDTPLSNALHSTQTQQGSPWTIEFLNRIREKSRLRHQAIPCNLTSPSFELPEKTSKFVKSKSPSIFEFYKYDGCTPNKVVDKRKLKRNSTPLKNSLKNERASASSMPQWTPVDKRARRMLSFSSNGSGGQSKLIWTDNNSHTSQRRL